MSSEPAHALTRKNKNMQIIAHRGLWRCSEEKNTLRAMQQAFQSGIGIETDIRDLDGELVISHDMPRRGALTLSRVLGNYVDAGSPGTLALNIKSDGLTIPLKYLLDYYGVRDYFCFDMSIPDTLPYLTAHMPVAARLSEYEDEGPLTRLAGALWWDAFSERFPPAEQLGKWLALGQSVCLVSPELHGRSPDVFWSRLAALPVSVRSHNGLMLCTDHPEQAGAILL
ncbi:hypothetical protein [Pantoea sp. Lu_F5_004]|uniref:hypothetical protein n=1 Tax=Pantoea sp. Lu_F5_004 TaxID=3443507 RepID=UPI003EC104A8